jgi:hypothetical protein
MNKGMFNFKSQIMKQEHNMCKTKFQQNFIVRPKRKQNKVMIKKNVPKIGVEQTKGNGEFYLYLCPLGT